jgi:hypothetical protein
MNKSPIFNIEIFLNNVLMYLQSIEIDLKLINQDDPNLNDQIRSLFTKHSNQFIKNNNNKINAINELKTFVLLNKDQQKDLSQMFINPIIKEITINQSNIEFILNEMNRFAINYLAIDFVQFLEFKTVWDTIKNDEVNKIIQHPFEDEKTNDLFNYLVTKWDYNKDQKWADIYIEIDESNEYKAPYKNEYQTFIIQTYGYTGKFQYDKVKDPNNRNRKALKELIINFSKK